MKAFFNRVIMGNKETKIEYETIDRTDPGAREKGRKSAIVENARLVRQLERELQEQRERGMATALGEVRSQNKQHAANRARKRQRREDEEVERKIAEKYRQDQLTFEKMKGELLNYEFGNKLPEKTFQGIDVSDMKRVLVALFGPTGSGKTSFIGTIERTLLGADKQTAFDQGSGGEGTVILAEYLASLKLNLLDTRGFWNIDDSTLTECLNVMTGKTRLFDVMTRDEDGSQLVVDGSAGGDVSARSMNKFTDRVHAVIFVVQANDKRLKEGTYLERMKKIREHFRFEGYSPITVITCEDTIKTDDDRETAFREASAATGSPIDRTFFISNYTSQNKVYSLDTEKEALDILDTALLSAERFVKIQKLRELHHGNAEDISIEEFVKQTASTYAWKNPERVAEVVRQLLELDIGTVKLLKDCWEDVKKEVKMTLGMKSGLEAALKNV